MIRRLKWTLTALLLAAAVAAVLDGQRIFDAITASPAEFLCDFQASARSVVRRQEFERNASDSSGRGVQPADDEAQLPVLDDQVGTPRQPCSESQLSAIDGQFARPVHESFVRTSADGTWSQCWSRDLQPDGTVVETPGPIMDEFTIPPSPTPAAFFDGSVRRVPDSFEWASDMGDPPPEALEAAWANGDTLLADLNQGVNYQPPPDGAADFESVSPDVLGETGIFTRERSNPDADGFYDLHAKSVSVTFVGSGSFPMKWREETLNQGTNYREPTDPVAPASELVTGLNQGVGYKPLPDQEVSDICESFIAIGTESK